MGAKCFRERITAKKENGTIEKKMKNYRLRSLFNWSLMRKPVEI